MSFILLKNMYNILYLFSGGGFMKVTTVELRYKIKEVIKALERNEKVTVLYHGKVKGVIQPAVREKSKKITEHPFFGMYSMDSQESVLKELDDLRKERYK